MRFEDMIKHLEDNEDALLMEPQSDYNPCIVGIGYRFHDGPVAVYDIDRIIETIMMEDGSTEEDAWDHYYFNIIGGWMGDGTPFFVHLLDKS